MEVIRPPNPNPNRKPKRNPNPHPILNPNPNPNPKPYPKPNPNPTSEHIMEQPVHGTSEPCHTMPHQTCGSTQRIVALRRHHAGASCRSLRGFVSCYSSALTYPLGSGLPVARSNSSASLWRGFPPACAPQARGSVRVNISMKMHLATRLHHSANGRTSCSRHLVGLGFGVGVRVSTLADFCLNASEGAPCLNVVRGDCIREDCEHLV